MISLLCPKPLTLVRGGNRVPMNFGLSFSNQCHSRSGQAIGCRMVVFRVVVVGLAAEETSAHTKGGAPAGSVVGYVLCQELDSCLLVATDETCDGSCMP